MCTQCIKSRSEPLLGIDVIRITPLNERGNPNRYLEKKRLQERKRGKNHLQLVILAPQSSNCFRFSLKHKHLVRHIKINRNANNKPFDIKTSSSTQSWIRIPHSKMMIQQKCQLFRCVVPSKRYLPVGRVFNHYFLKKYSRKNVQGIPTHTRQTLGLLCSAVSRMTSRLPPGNRYNPSSGSSTIRHFGNGLVLFTFQFGFECFSIDLNWMDSIGVDSKLAESFALWKFRSVVRFVVAVVSPWLLDPYGDDRLLGEGESPSHLHTVASQSINHHDSAGSQIPQSILDIPSKRKWRCSFWSMNYRSSSWPIIIINYILLGTAWSALLCQARARTLSTSAKTSLNIEMHLACGTGDNP